MKNQNLFNSIKPLFVFFMLLPFVSTCQETVESEVNPNTTSAFHEQAFFDSLVAVKKTAKRTSLKSAISDMFYNGDFDSYLHVGITNHSRFYIIDWVAKSNFMRPIHTISDHVQFTRTTDTFL